MKEKLVILIVLFCLILLTGCSKSSTEVEDESTSYYITITNNSSHDITELVISMVGSDDIQQISILQFGGYTSQNFEFQLPEPSDDNPISFGDYNFSYLQNNEEMNFGIIQPETHISVYINDDGYTVHNMTRCITIINESSYNVTELEISMDGALEFFQVNEINPGESSSEFEFHLIKSSPVSCNYGCYYGFYNQNNNTNSFLFSPLGNTNITMVIMDDSYGMFINN